MAPALLVIAKEPVPGRVKTRLTPPCTPEQAAQLAAAAIADTLAAVRAVERDVRRIVVLDGEPGRWIPDGFEVIAQRGDGLSERLAAAFEDCGGPAFLVGMDTPQVTTAHLDAGLDAVRDGDAAFGAAFDGGYWGIGLREPDPRVFEDVPMSEDNTGAVQRARLAILGLRTAILPPLRDIDTIEDARAVAREAPDGRLAAALAEIEPEVAGRMSAEPVPVPAERTTVDAGFAPRALHAVPDAPQTLPADQLYGRLLASAALHATGDGPPHEGRLRRADGRLEPLPLAHWLGPVDEADKALLARVEGSALDIGCGPGRHVAALQEAGHVALGIDLSPVAVQLTIGRGADAILGSVFEHVPDSGSWGTALLLDGNIGIGGAPAGLLGRARELLAPGGALLAELDPPGAWSGVTRVRLEAPDVVSEWFPWAQVGVDTVAEVAAEAGLEPDWTMCSGERWFMALRRT